MSITGLILAGGLSSRMGENKAFVKLGDENLLEHVYQRLYPQCKSVLIGTNSYDQRFGCLQTIPDTIPGQLGPLAGILAGLEYVVQQQNEWLVTVPVDCPFLPRDMVKRLMANATVLPSPLAAESVEHLRERRSPLPLQKKVPNRTGEGDLNHTIILASSNNQTHYTTGLWHQSLIKSLKHALNNGIRKVEGFTRPFNCQSVEWKTVPIDPFFNVNTHEDLTKASIFLNSASAAAM